MNVRSEGVEKEEEEVLCKSIYVTKGERERQKEKEKERKG